ncbi:hypothetical protein ACFYXM_02520 [Streptomyces sp. NPDC002476]|uniref:hypothetical protein n=1 Tax=Streptomyces sp. NPDC002476 TaxID=3364648 RepID=UPI0036C6C9EB
MGYLYDSFLHHQGADIHRLAEAADVAVGCHGWIELNRVDAFECEEDDEHASDGEEDRLPNRRRPFTRAEQLAAVHWIGRVRLNLPDADELRSLVMDFLEAGPAVAQTAPRRAPSGIDAPAGPAARVPADVSTGTSADIPEQGAGAADSGLRGALHGRLAAQLRAALAARAASGTRGRETARDRVQALRDERAEAELRAWARYRRRPHTYEDLRAVSRTVHGTHKVLVLDRTGLEVGEYLLPDGPLTLIDERARPEALVALRRHGVEPGEPSVLAGLDAYPTPPCSPKRPGRSG